LSKLSCLQQMLIRCQLCVLQRIWGSLPKLYCLQRICNLLLKLSCLQRINIRYRIVCSAANLKFHCQNSVFYSELTFAAKLCVLQWIWDSLPNLNCLQWICNSLPKLSCLQRINIWCRIVCSAANMGFAAEVILFATNL